MAKRVAPTINRQSDEIDLDLDMKNGQDCRDSEGNRKPAPPVLGRRKGSIRDNTGLGVCMTLLPAAEALLRGGDV